MGRTRRYLDDELGVGALRTTNTLPKPASSLTVLPLPCSIGNRFRQCPTGTAGHRLGSYLGPKFLETRLPVPLIFHQGDSRETQR